MTKLGGFVMMCADCKFYMETDTINHRGECHCRPPQIVICLRRDDKTIFDLQRNPMVESDVPECADFVRAHP